MPTARSCWYFYLICGMVAAFGHLFLPSDGLAIALAFLAIATSGPIAIARTPARRQLPWALLLAGSSLMVAGDALWIYSQHVLHVDPFPSLADALYLPGYPLIGAALIALVRRRAEASRHIALIDASIIATGLGTLAWVSVIAPFVGDPTLTDLQRVVSAAYPLAGVVLSATVIRLAFGRHSATDVLLAAGVLSLLAADIVLAVSEAATGYLWHPVAEFLWLAMYVSFGAAALHATSSDRRAPPAQAAKDAAAPPEASPVRFAALLAACLMAPAMLVVHEIKTHDGTVVIIAVASAVLSALVLLRMRELLQRVQRQAEELARLATIDPLTGVANRRCWDHAISRLVADAERRAHPLSVALLDLDNFKRYNDTNGHLAGDNLLSTSALRWRDLLRPTDFIARYGGEEFAIALPETTPADAVAVLERLRGTMPEGQTFSAGIAAWTTGDTLDQLLERADRALYTAKNNGRDCVLHAASLPTVRGDAGVALHPTRQRAAG